MRGVIWYQLSSLPLMIPVRRLARVHILEAGGQGIFDDRSLVWTGLQRGYMDFVLAAWAYVETWRP